MGLTGKSSASASPRAVGLASSVGAACILASSAAWLAWTAVRPLGPVASESSNTAPTKPSTELSERFARIPDVAMVSSAPMRGAPSSGGEFVLFAARATADGRGTAIISANGAPQHSYYVGEEITPGVRLTRVEADRVEIETRGGTLTVGFPNAAPVSEASIASLRGPTLDALPLVPASRADGGYQITSQADLSLLAGSGLRPGDIILKVDGAGVSPSSLAEHARRLQAGNTLEIVYERNGQTATTRIGSRTVQ